MLAKVYSAAVQGVESSEIEIEVNNTYGEDLRIVVVGLPDTAVKESKDRVITAIDNSGFYFPQGRTTINLAPADVKKEGPSFDLPIALAMIAVAQQASIPAVEQYCIVGELALTGAIRPVKGVLPIALEAKRRGRTKLLVPQINAREAALVEGIDVYGVRDLRQAYSFMLGKEQLLPTKEDLATFFSHSQQYDVDFSEVRGQHSVKRAIEVAVAGGHNMLMLGPPGSGKSMLAKRIPTLLPPLSLAESIEATKIHSIAGLLLDAECPIVGRRPFRSPHHTISDIGLIGGSVNPSPGEISLAHQGVLFLDELPEFRRTTLEVLRQPLEDGRVTISRAAGTMTFPAEFMLVAAMNPCPCGFYGDTRRQCRCLPLQVDRYRQRISGPLLDRIDIHVEVPAVEFRELSSSEAGESSEQIRLRVMQARTIQQERFAEHPRIRCNARMSSQWIKRCCALDETAQGILEAAMNELNFSARAYDRILKVARTIADLEGSEAIAPFHLQEAIHFRTLDRNLWG